MGQSAANRGSKRHLNTGGGDERERNRSGGGVAITDAGTKDDKGRGNRAFQEDSTKD